MIFLLDSNAFSDLMRQAPGLEAKLAGLGATTKSLSAQSCVEKSCTDWRVCHQDAAVKF